MKLSDFKIDNKGSVPVIGALAISGVLYAFNLYSLDNSTVKYNSVENNRISNALGADFYSSVKKIDQAVQSGDLTACDSSAPPNRFILDTSNQTGISQVVKGNSQYLKIEKCVPRKTSTAQWNDAFRNLTNPDDRGSCLKSVQEIKVEEIKCSSLGSRYAVLSFTGNAKANLGFSTRKENIKKTSKALIYFPEDMSCARAKDKGFIKKTDFPITVEFPRTRGGDRTLCSENAENKGNWRSEGAGEIYGIHTQTETLELPKDMIFCGISISGSSRGFYYDDGFALTLNNLILATGRFGPNRFDYHVFDERDPNAEANHEIREWSFEKIKGRDYDSTGEEGCSVATTDKDEEGNDQVACNVPKTESTGRFILNPTKKVSRLLSRHLGLKNKSSSDLKNQIKFQLHVTGDDDEEIDCKHSGLKLDLEFEYFSKADFK